MTGDPEIKRVCIQARDSASVVKIFAGSEIYLTDTLPSGDVVVYKESGLGIVEVAGLQIGIPYLTRFGDTYVKLEDPPEACREAIIAYFVDAKKLGQNECVLEPNMAEKILFI